MTPEAITLEGTVTRLLSDGRGEHPPMVAVASSNGRAVALVLDCAPWNVPATGTVVTVSGSLIARGDGYDVPDVVLHDAVVDRRLAQLFTSGVALDGFEPGDASGLLPFVVRGLGLAANPGGDGAAPAVAWANAFFAPAEEKLGHPGLTVFVDPRLLPAGDPDAAVRAARGLLPPGAAVERVTNLTVRHAPLGPEVSAIFYDDPFQALPAYQTAMACADATLFLPRQRLSRHEKVMQTIAHEVGHRYQRAMIGFPQPPAPGQAALDPGECFADAVAVMASAAGGMRRAALANAVDLRMASWLFSGSSHATGEAMAAALGLVDSGAAPTDPVGILHAAATIARDTVATERSGRRDVLARIGHGDGLTGVLRLLADDPGAAAERLRAAAADLVAEGAYAFTVDGPVHFTASAERLVAGLEAARRAFWTPHDLREPDALDAACRSWAAALDADCEERRGMGTAHLVPSMLARMTADLAAAEADQERAAADPELSLERRAASALGAEVARRQRAAVQALLERPWANTPGAVPTPLRLPALAGSDHAAEMTRLLALPPKRRLAALLVALDAERQLAAAIARGGGLEDPARPYVCRQARRHAALALLLDPVCLEAAGPDGRAVLTRCTQMSALCDMTGSVALKGAEERLTLARQAWSDLDTLQREVWTLANVHPAESFRQRMRRLHGAAHALETGMVLAAVGDGQQDAAAEAQPQRPPLW